MLPRKDTTLAHQEGQHQYALEDMISSLQTRGSLEDLTEDPLELLRQRERDLVLAAELGKALLERNQELTKKSDALAEKYAKRIEVLEQERHLMRRKLEEARGESEACALELQSDLETLRRQLDEQSERARRAERDQASLVSELTAQNSRLAEQLREAARQEEQLLAELKTLREKCATRSTTLQDHVSSLEVLKDEVQLVSAQRTELERRSLELREERARAIAALEEAEERATALERLGHEAERRAAVAERERDELAEALAAMESSSRVVASDSRGSPSRRQPRSLQAEMECEESGTSSLGAEPDEAGGLRQEVGRACRRLRELASHLQRGEDDSGLQSDCDESMLGLNNAGEAENNCADALTDLVEEVFGLALAGVRGAPGDLGLAVELHRAKEELDQTREQLRQAQEELRRRSESLVETASKLKLSEAELLGAREERDRARGDIEHSQLSKDEVLAQAIQTRDQAVARKNKVEVELARTRIDMLQINSQLMEAIQQKIELSEQLEQWQMDMQQLLDEHVRSKLAPVGNSPAPGSSEAAEVRAPARKKRNGTATGAKKRFGIF